MKEEDLLRHGLINSKVEAGINNKLILSAFLHNRKLIIDWFYQF